MKNRKSTTLLELLVALAIFSTVILAISSIETIFSRMTSQDINQGLLYQGTSYSLERILKQIQDSNYLEVVTNSLKLTKKRQLATVQRVKEATVHFNEKYSKLPDELSELIPKYIESTPIDLFNSKEVGYSYEKGEDGSFIVYSFGPDSYDDMAKIEYDEKMGSLATGT